MKKMLARSFSAEAVKAQATQLQAELARSVLRGDLQRDLAVGAWDERQPVLQAKLTPGEPSRWGAGIDEAPRENSR